MRGKVLWEVQLSRVCEVREAKKREQAGGTRLSLAHGSGLELVVLDLEALHMANEPLNTEGDPK